AVRFGCVPPRLRTAPGLRSLLLVARDFLVAALVTPAVAVLLEELLQDRLDRLALLAAAGSHEALDRLEVGRQRLLGVVVPAQQAAIDAVLDRRQVRGRLLVVADVELNVVHGLAFGAFR